MHLLFISLSLLVSTAAFGNASLKTEIQYRKDAKKAAAGQDPFVCKGHFSQPKSLERIGYSDKDLSAGVPCEKADFDGNGTDDFFFQKCDESARCRSAIVLMQKNDLLKTIALKQAAPIEVLSTKQKPTHAGLVALGCKIPSVAAFVHLGEGDGNDNIIYSLDKNREQLIESSKCTNVEGAD